MDIPFRAALVMTLVGFTVVIGRFFGAAAAGVAGVVPTAMFSLAIILHLRIGGTGASAAFSHTLPGLVGWRGGGNALRHSDPARRVAGACRLRLRLRRLERESGAAASSATASARAIDLEATQGKVFMLGEET
ncbi:MAG: hypothetical protein M9883_04585 [Methylobacteriaceae bacterium]|nr:hypothetical protein [Methylobacteriaceae bacterium]